MYVTVVLLTPDNCQCFVPIRTMGNLGRTYYYYHYQLLHYYVTLLKGPGMCVQVHKKVFR